MRDVARAFIVGTFILSGLISMITKDPTGGMTLMGIAFIISELPRR